MSECYCFSAPVKGCPTHDPEPAWKNRVIEHDPGSGPTAAERNDGHGDLAAGTYYWAKLKKDSKGLPVPWSWIYGSAQWNTDPIDEIATVVKALKESFDQCREEEAQGILDLPREEKS